MSRTAEAILAAVVFVLLVVAVMASGGCSDRNAMPPLYGPDGGRMSWDDLPAKYR